MSVVSVEVPIPFSDRWSVVSKGLAGLRLRYERVLDSGYAIGSERAAEVAESFALGMESVRLEAYRRFELELEPGWVVYVTGESGGGKSLLLRFLAEALSKHDEFSPVVASWKIRVRAGRPVIDTVGRSLQEALEILTSAGLTDVFTWHSPHDRLSDGQKLRHIFALALGMGGRTIILDEFCSNLDRATAKATAYTVQRYARRAGVTLVAGTAMDDLVEDLKPDLLIVKHIGPVVDVRRLNVDKNCGCSLLERMRVEEGGYDDWLALSFLHYRGHRTGGVRRIFRLSLDGMAGSERRLTAGVVVYATPFHRAGGFANCFNHEWYEVNRFDKVHRIQRIVIHPSFRGIGAGKLLLRESMPRLEVPFVEILSSMQRLLNFTAGLMIPFEDGPSPEKLKALKSFEEMFGVSLARCFRSQVFQDIGRLRSWVMENYGVFMDRRVEMPLSKLRDKRALLLALQRIRVSASPKVYAVWINPDPRFRRIQLKALKPEFVQKHASWLLEASE